MSLCTFMHMRTPWGPSAGFNVPAPTSLLWIATTSAGAAADMSSVTMNQAQGRGLDANVGVLKGGVCGSEDATWGGYLPLHLIPLCLHYLNPLLEVRSFADLLELQASAYELFYFLRWRF
jgi:hypothetical protein